MEWLNKDTEKINVLNKFMKNLINAETGSKKKTLIEENKSVIDSINPVDLFFLDMYQDDSSVEEIKETAGKFVNVFYEGLMRHTHVYEHEFFTYLLEENELVTEHLASMKSMIKGDILEHRSELLELFFGCMMFDKKYQKYENILFPNVEGKVPSNKPLQVLWSLYSDARDLLKELIESLKGDFDKKEFLYLVGQYYFLVFGIIQKEQLIFLPVAYKLFSNELMDKMLKETGEYGFAFMNVDVHTEHEGSEFLDGMFLSRTGELDFKQLTLMLNHLPVDITFVDKHDCVKYFNDNPNRHFPRNPSIIGRLVKYCHPPKSVEVVERIVEAFKNGTKEMAEFWMTFRGRTLYITYYAVKDSDGNYEGVLEVSQDVTHIKEISGEKRLLDWDD